MQKLSTGRLVNGMIAKAFSQGGQIAIRLLEVPLFLYFWGVDSYGEWLILTALPAYLSMSDFGFVGVANSHITMLTARGKQQEALSSFQSLSLLVLLTSCLITISFVAGVYFAPIESLFNITTIDHGEVVLISCFMGLRIIFSMQTQMLFSGLQSCGKYPQGFAFLGMIQIGEFLMTALVVIAGATPGLTAGAILIANMLGFSGVFYYFSHNIPAFYYGTEYFSFSRIRVLIRPAIAALALPVGQASNSQAPRLIIGSLLGPASVTIFTVHRQLARLTVLLSSMSVVFQAELSILYGGGQSSDFRLLSRRVVQIFGWLAFATALFIFTGGSEIIKLWTDGAVDYSSSLMLLLVATSLGEALWRAALVPITATNNHIVVAHVFLIGNLLLIPSMYFLGKIQGLDGIAACLIVQELIMIPVVFRKHLVLTTDSIADLAKTAMVPPFYLFRVLQKHIAWYR